MDMLRFHSWFLLNICNIETLECRLEGTRLIQTKDGKQVEEPLSLNLAEQQYVKHHIADLLMFLTLKLHVYYLLDKHRIDAIGRNFSDSNYNSYNRERNQESLEKVIVSLNKESVNTFIYNVKYGSNSLISETGKKYVPYLTLSESEKIANIVNTYVALEEILSQIKADHDVEGRPTDNIDSSIDICLRDKILEASKKYPQDSGIASLRAGYNLYLIMMRGGITYKYNPQVVELLKKFKEIKDLFEIQDNE